MLERYKTVYRGKEGEIIEKKSRFIATVRLVETEEEALAFIEEMKKKYWNATHNCFAYVIGERRECVRCSDDGEPSGTAGIPILLVLEKQNLSHVLCIVVRYFGKIKLGAGGLVRAYTKSATEVLKNHTIFLKKGYLIQITFPYSSQKTIDYLLKNKKILKKDFQEKVSYQLAIDETDFQNLSSLDDLEIKIMDNLYLPDLDNN